MKDLSRKVTLLCPVCGNTQFEAVNEDNESFTDASDDATYRCADCGSVYTKQELLNENKEIIDNTVEDIKQDAIKEIEKELRKAFKKWK